jgi:hypothetical protein
MSETGWPLIPRELLPAPIKRVRRPRPPADQRPSPGRQLSIFGAETTEPSPADLAGLLAGPGRLERMGGTARVTVPVDAGWRVHVLMNELVRRGLVVSWHPLAGGSAEPEPVPDRRRAAAPEREDDERHGDDRAGYDDGGWADEPGSAVIGGGAREAEAGRGGGGHGEVSDPSAPPEPGESDDPGETGHNGDSGVIADQWRAPRPAFEVRTAYSSRLNALARSWPGAADRLFLSGPWLRLWITAAGYRADDGFRLVLSGGQDPAIVDAALVRAGLAGTMAVDRRTCLIDGERRLARLAELVGQRPAEAPPGAWPGDVEA